MRLSCLQLSADWSSPCKKRTIQTYHKPSWNNFSKITLRLKINTSKCWGGLSTRHHGCSLWRAPIAAVRQLEVAFADFGLKVLGPTKNQLVMCADAIAQSTDAITAAVTQSDMTADATAPELAARYRAFTRR